MKIAVIVFMLILTGAQALYAQSKDDVEAAIHMDKFLTDHNPERNFDPAEFERNAGKSHSLIEAVTNDTNHIAVYAFSWTCSHSCPCYIMVIDFRNKDYQVYGQYTSIDDLRDLHSYFFSHPFFKESTQLRCYDFLITNGYCSYSMYPKNLVRH